MKRRSAVVIAGMLVSALLAGVVSREATLAHQTVTALKPSAVVIQQPAPAPAPAPVPASAYRGETNDY